VPFRKQKRFDYQREYRICIRTLHRLAEPRTFNIGSLRGFGGYIPSERVLKAFKLSLAGKAACQAKVSAFAAVPAMQPAYACPRLDAPARQTGPSGPLPETPLLSVDHEVGRYMGSAIVADFAHRAGSQFAPHERGIRAGGEQMPSGLVTLPCCLE
jgi:hypothetical protein